MPNLTATDGLALDAIKRVDTTPEDIRKMSDEELVKFLADLRQGREVAMGQSRPRKVSQPKSNDVAVADDGSIDSDV